MQHRRPSVLLVGDSHCGEFAGAVRWLRAHTQLEVVPTVAAALDRLRVQQRFWHTLVLAQSRPGQFAQRDVDRLGQALPLTHMVALLGSCCEGESRSGRPWPGVVRVYWHQFAARAASELWSGDAATSWQLQRTASDAERVDHALQTPPPAVPGVLAVCTRQAVFYDALSSACRLAGCSTVWISPAQWSDVPDVTAVLWHGPLQGPAEWQQLQQVATRTPRVPVIALWGFPRRDDVQRLEAAGAAAVVSLPLLLPDLWNTLQEVAR